MDNIKEPLICMLEQVQCSKVDNNESVSTYLKFSNYNFDWDVAIIHTLPALKEIEELHPTLLRRNSKPIIIIITWHTYVMMFFMPSLRTKHNRQVN